MTQSRQSARKVGDWRMPDETTIERIMLQGLQIQLLYLYVLEVYHDIYTKSC